MGSEAPSASMANRAIKPVSRDVPQADATARIAATTSHVDEPRPTPVATEHSTSSRPATGTPMNANVRRAALAAFCFQAGTTANDASAAQNRAVLPTPLP